MFMIKFAIILINDDRGSTYSLNSFPNMNIAMVNLFFNFLANYVSTLLKYYE